MPAFAGMTDFIVPLPIQFERIAIFPKPQRQERR